MFIFLCLHQNLAGAKLRGKENQVELFDGIGWRGTSRRRRPVADVQGRVQDEVEGVQRVAPRDRQLVESWRWGRVRTPTYISWRDTQASLGQTRGTNLFDFWTRLDHQSDLKKKTELITYNGRALVVQHFCLQFFFYFLIFKTGVGSRDWRTTHGIRRLEDPWWQNDGTCWRRWDISTWNSFDFFFYEDWSLFPDCDWF